LVERDARSGAELAVAVARMVVDRVRRRVRSFIVDGFVVADWRLVTAGV